MALRWKAGHDTVRDWTTGVETPRPTFDGAVLGFRHRTERIMSDVWEDVGYAVVWDGTKVTEVAVGDSYSGSYADHEADATPDAYGKAMLWTIDDEGRRWLAERHAGWDRMVAAAHRVEVGKEVAVVRGRKVPKGTTGRVFWMGDSRFGRRVGLRDATGTVHWTALTNVEVTNPEDYIEVPADYPPTAEAIRMAGSRAVSKLLEDEARWKGGPNAWMLREPSGKVAA